MQQIKKTNNKKNPKMYNDAKWNVRKCLWEGLNVRNKRKGNVYTNCNCLDKFKYDGRMTTVYINY